MAIKAIGNGQNRRRQSNLPWWARNFGAVCLWLGVFTMIIMGFFCYATWLGYVLVAAFKLWFKGLVQHGTVLPALTQIGLSWAQVLDWTKAWPFNQGENPARWWGFLAGALTVGLVWSRIIRTYLVYTGNEKGAESFTSPKQLRREYPVIADRLTSFAGHGGIPLVHYNTLVGRAIQRATYHPWGHQLFQKFADRRALLPSGQYAIDSSTVNSLIYGITRSGKGETVILPLIDNLSRADEPSSMVINDPKGEIFQMSDHMLKKRGYRVYVLNMQNMDKSMAYNPLAIVIDYAKRGYYDEAQREANRISTAIYRKSSESKDQFWENSSINLLNALIYSQLDMAARHGTWERVTMNNIYRELTELGGQKVYKRVGPKLVEKSQLTRYFEAMAAAPHSALREMALQAFQQSNFAGSETAGSIYASMMEGIKLYQQRDLARLTSLNSLDFRELAFPRQLRLGFPAPLALQTATIRWFDPQGQVLEQRKQKLDRQGYLVVPVKTKLPAKFKLTIDFNHSLTKVEYRQYQYSYTGTLQTKRTNPLATTEQIQGATIEFVGTNSICYPTNEPQVIDFKYSEQPTALFLVTPPHNPAYNQLVTFAVDQAFNQMYEMALANDRICFTRVHFIIDEGGNLPKIPELDHKFSIGLGAELLFDFVLQNKGQLRINYSEQEAETIIKNCGNTLYILSEDAATQKEISEAAGHLTVNLLSRQMRGDIDATNNLNSSLEAVPLISPEELGRLKAGEMVVIRSTKRTDQKGRLIRANPIFDTGATRMPSRWQFLNQTFDNQANVNDIAVNTPHEQLDLKYMQYDYLHDSQQSELALMATLAGWDAEQTDDEDTPTNMIAKLKTEIETNAHPEQLQQQLLDQMDMNSARYQELKLIQPDQVKAYLLKYLAQADDEFMALLADEKDLPSIEETKER